MTFLLEYKINDKWFPRRILDEDNIRQALDNLVIHANIEDWRVRKIKNEDIIWINKHIARIW